jgi:hypothetical protein
MLQKVRPLGSAKIPTPDTFKSIDANAVTAGTEEVVWTPSSGKTIRLLGWRLSSSVAASIQFQDSAASGTIIAQTPVLAAAGIDDRESLGRGIVLASPGNTLKIDVSASATISGMVFGVEE